MRTHGKVSGSSSAKKNCQGILAHVYGANMSSFRLSSLTCLESRRSSFSTSLTSENLRHTGDSRGQVRREKLVKENLPVRTGLNRISSMLPSINV